MKPLCKFFGAHHDTGEGHQEAAVREALAGLRAGSEREGSGCGGCGWGETGWPGGRRIACWGGVWACRSNGEKLTNIWRANRRRNLWKFGFMRSASNGLPGLSSSGE